MSTPPAEVVLTSVITCPDCGHVAEEVMPTEACQWFWDCPGCGAVLKPKAGDCCVYCSYSNWRPLLQSSF